MTFDWTLFDAFYIISVYGAEDRLKRTIDRTRSVDIPQDRIRLIKDPPRQNRLEAIWNNHRRAWFDMLENGLELAVVFEDDIAIDHPLTPDALREVSSWIAGHRDAFDIFYLGHWPISNMKEVAPGIVEVKSQLSHAYVIGADTAAKIAPIEPLRLRGLDEGFLARFPRQHAVYPMFFHQEATPSSRNSRINLYNLKDAVSFQEQAAFEGRIWPSVGFLSVYLQLLRLAGGRLDVGREVLDALFSQVPRTVYDAMQEKVFRRTVF